jgi:ubiquinone/menaquinone biosynthesis C-methylase UbiE
MNLEYAKEIIKENKKTFNEIAREFSKTRQEIWPELKELSKYIKENERILDLACGNGRLFVLFKDKNIKYFGLDGSKNLINIARKRYGNFFQVGDVLDLPFPDNFFDSVWFIAAIHHLPSLMLRRQALKEISRVLRKKGIIIATCWNLYQFRYLDILFKHSLKKIFRKSKLDFKDIFIPWQGSLKRYYHAFTRRELRKLFKSSGFQVKEIKYLERKDKKNNILIIAKL